MSKKQDHENQIERMKEISILIKNWRINDMISQSVLGNMSNAHVNTVRNLEAAKNVTVITLFNCIDALGVTIGEFFAGIE